MDILLVEGFRLEQIPKIEVYRPSLGKPAFFHEDANIIAVASDAGIAAGDRMLLPLNCPDMVAAFIVSLAAVRS